MPTNPTRPEQPKPAADNGRTGVCLPDGFVATGCTAGLKPSGRPDLALVVNQGPDFTGAAVFTSNRFAAAPVICSRENLQTGIVRAVVLNSGGANACTGEGGYVDARAMARATGQALDVPEREVMVASTGIIGQRLPIDAVVRGIEAAAPTVSITGGAAAAEAIMTTDTIPKQAAVTNDQGWSIGGMAKGAGMLAPGLATMLVVLTTDASASSDDLQQALKAATTMTFDRLDSDGCMSTNDSVYLLASGASGQSPSVPELTDALVQVCADLGRQLMADAEGAEHEIQIETRGAASVDDALEVSRSIARSNLFKTAIAGCDPNWGRTLAAIGTTDAEFDPDQVDVGFNGVLVCRGGQIGDDRDLVDLHPRDVHVLVDLHAGDYQASIWTNDLTHGYVTENADYTT